jgi:arylsulfatase A-like enzyme
MTLRDVGLFISAGVLALLPAGGCSAPKEVSRVVIVTLDTTRADRLGCYGHEAAVTPNLDRLAETGVLFEQAVSPVPTTLPSHSTMFTGLYPQDHGVRYNLVFRLGPESLTLAEILGSHGFRTAGFPAAYVLDRRYGLNQGFDVYGIEDVGLEPSDRDDKLNGRRAGQIVDAALRWLDTNSDEEKQFLWVHFYDPHAPYVPPIPFSSTFRDHPYDGEIAYVDQQVGRLVDRLQSSPAWDHTLLIVAGDHGEGLHEHRERFHANLVYESTQHVPFVVHAPGVVHARIAEPVTLADITPTVLDLVGIAPLEEFRGVSLAEALRGGDPPRRDIYFESLAGSLNYGWHELHGIRYGRWKLIDSADPQLFDLDEDPDELVNLAELETRRVADLTEVLRELSESTDPTSPAQRAHDPVTDPETEAMLASLGYVAGTTGGSAAGAPNPRDLIDLEPELMAGQSAVARREWAIVEDICGYVLGRDPTNRWALNNLVGALMQTERLEEAQDVAAEFVRIYPEDERGYVLLARAYRARDGVDEAAQVLAQGLKSAGDSANLRFLSIVAAFEQDGVDPCEDQVPGAVERYPASALMLVMQARCEARQGRTEQALGTLERAVEIGFSKLEDLDEVEDFAELARTSRYEGMVAEMRQRRDEKEAPGPGDYDPSVLRPF